MPSKISRIYLGIPQKRNSTVKIRLSENKNKIIIGCVAFHASFKGIDILIEAVEILINKGIKNFEVWQIGGGLASSNGKDTEQLQNLVKEKDLERWFKWLGICQDIDTLMSHFDIYVQPSRNEAISFTIAEAMSHGVPVVASNVGGIPEYIEDGKTGLLYNKNSPIQLAQKLQFLMDDYSLRQKLSIEGFNYINSDKFDIKKSVEATLDRYCR